MNNSFYAVIWRFIVCPFRVSAEKPLSVSVTHLLSQELGDAWSPRRLLEQSPATEPTGGCMSTPAASDKGLPGCVKHVHMPTHTHDSPSPPTEYDGFIFPSTDTSGILVDCFKSQGPAITHRNITEMSE